MRSALRNLLITQTHDTKRSGDVRARLVALAGITEEWATHVRRSCAYLRGGRDPPGARGFTRRPAAGATCCPAPGASRP